MNFEKISEMNLARANRWHPGGLKDWSIADWATATAGEAGEVCNALKKLKRAQQQLKQAEGPKSIHAAVAQVGTELGDTCIYLNLEAVRIGTTLQCCAEAVTDEHLVYPFGTSLGEMGCDLMTVVGDFCEKMHVRDSEPEDEPADLINEIAIGRVYNALVAIATKLGLNLEQCVVETFNRVSEREGFPERLDLAELRAAA